MQFWRKSGLTVFHCTFRPKNGNSDTCWPVSLRCLFMSVYILNSSQSYHMLTSRRAAKGLKSSHGRAHAVLEVDGAIKRGLDQPLCVFVFLVYNCKKIKNTQSRAWSFHQTGDCPTTRAPPGQNWRFLTKVFSFKYISPWWRIFQIFFHEIPAQLFWVAERAAHIGEHWVGQPLAWGDEG